MITYELLRRSNEPRHIDNGHSRRIATVFDLYHHPAYLRKAARRQIPRRRRVEEAQETKKGGAARTEEGTKSKDELTGSR